MRAVYLVFRLGCLLIWVLSLYLLIDRLAMGYYYTKLELALVIAVVVVLITNIFVMFSSFVAFAARKVRQFPHHEKS